MPHKRWRQNLLYVFTAIWLKTTNLKKLKKEFVEISSGLALQVERFQREEFQCWLEKVIEKGEDKETLDEVLLENVKLHRRIKKLEMDLKML